MDTTKTMRQLCEDEPLLESFLVLKGFPFSLENPIVDLVTFDDVCQVRSLARDSFLAEFEAYKAGADEALVASVSGGIA
ncbi:nitrate ABC transporter ATPase [Slackia exigua]|nr:nitrate ABC transporter ATPase [Slackia exigua]MDK7724287.1 nitrate ABC transporter ATPase [Slackia exigua]